MDINLALGVLERCRSIWALSSHSDVAALLCELCTLAARLAKCNRGLTLSAAGFMYASIALSRSSAVAGA